MRKVKISKQKVVLSLTKKEFDVFLELVEDRSYECICDLDSFQGIPIPKGVKPYLQKCDLICKMASQLRFFALDVHVVGSPCPFDDSSRG